MRKFKFQSTGICNFANSFSDTPPPPAPVPHRQAMNDIIVSPVKQESEIHSALKDIRTSLQKSKINNPDNSPCIIYGNNYAASEKVDSPTASLSPVWIPR